jgi:hypothetical protein
MAEDTSTDTSVLTIKRLNSESRPPRKGTRVTAMPAWLLAEASLDRDEQGTAEPIE